MQKKQLLIFEAAASLFAEHGFDGVTTQQISEKADVAAGTLFRYASSKSELLIMVHNEEFRRAFAIGQELSLKHSAPAESIFALLEPILAAGSEHASNAAFYQRELLFGSPTERYRSEGLALVAELEAAIALRLTTSTSEKTNANTNDDREGDVGASAHAQREASRAARSVFAVLHLLVAQPATGAHADSNASEELRAQVTQIVNGFAVSIARPEDTPAR